MDQQTEYLERMAQTCIDDVSYAKQLLVSGKTIECLSILSELEEVMALVMAMNDSRSGTTIN